MSDYKLVPVEPTLNMLCGGMEVYCIEDCAEAAVLGIYKAMLAAAPAVQGDPVVRLADYEALQAAHEEEIFCVRQDRDAHFGELMRALEQVDAMKAECEKLRTAMIEAKGHIDHYMYGGSSYRKPAAEAIALIDAALTARREGGEA